MLWHPASMKPERDANNVWGAYVDLYGNRYRLDPDTVLSIDYEPTIAALNLETADRCERGKHRDYQYRDAIDAFFIALKAHGFKAHWMEKPDSPTAAAYSRWLETRKMLGFSP
ncbi:hypothetical protein BDW62DRAFT_179680 [Aspergillus aurantiobrunneus]